MLNRASATETAEGTMAVLLAREAGIRHFVYQSVHCLDELAYLPHVASKLAIQNALVVSGLAYTLICPNHFYQNDEVVRGPLMEQGVYATPLGAIGCDGVDARDIAEAARHCSHARWSRRQSLCARRAGTAHVAGCGRNLV